MTKKATKIYPLMFLLIATIACNSPTSTALKDKNEIHQNGDQNRTSIDCINFDIESGAKQECTFRNTTVKAAYKNFINEKEKEEPNVLLQELPPTSKIITIKKNGLISIEYKIEKSKTTITMSYDGGETEIIFEQNGPDVKRIILYDAD